MKVEVLIVMGSDSDLPIMENAKNMLDEFGISSEMVIASAHRTPEKVVRLVRDAEKKGIEVIIAGAGMAAHLAGVIASHTLLPVIGVPLDSSPLKGLDALLSIVQMPAGVPVATVAIGKVGAKNAAILSAEIVAKKRPEIIDRLKDYRKRLAEEVERKASILTTRVK